jgi:predicted N-acyltransferase
MPVDSQWKSFDDYLKVLNTKFRTKAKSAYKKSAQVEIRKPTAQWILENRMRMQELYEAVHERPISD